VIELICEVDCELLTEPGQTLICEPGDRLRVQFVPLDDCQLGAHRSFEEDDSSQSDGQHEFDEHEVPEGAEIVVLMLFVLMSDEEVYEDVEEFSSHYDQI
jgi:hypothetical protein